MRNYNPPMTSCDIEIRVRYPEVDKMGVVHHSRYWVYFEMGRIELLRASGVSYADCEARGVFFAVVRCAARYHAPARFDESLRLTTRIVKVGAARIDHAYELRRAADEQLIATAETTVAPLDAEGRVVPIPEEIRQAARL